MKNQHITIIILALIIFIASCDLEREIDLNLPEFESELVVECYLEPGKPMRAVISETISYFGSGLGAALPVVNGAVVKITHNGNVYTLDEGAYFDFISGKIFNYGSDDIVPFDFDNDFHLEVTDSAGRVLTATTRLLQPTPLDSIQTVMLQDSSITVLTIHTDNPSETNFWYRTYHRTHVIADSFKIGFALDDEFINGQNNQLVIGGPPVFEHGDTAVITLFHIEEAYSQFIETTGAAESNNGNPFGTPGTIKSNVSGGMGIFTGLTYVRDTFYLN
jgi:hypothetical protein